MQERWKEVAEREKGETHEEKAAGLYFDLKEKAEKDPALAGLFAEVEKWVKEYAFAVLKTQRDKTEHPSKEVIEAHEQHRRTVHNALISVLRQLSRNFQKKGLDNSWRHGVGLDPEDREVLGQWALDVVRGVMDIKEEEEVR